MRLNLSILAEDLVEYSFYSSIHRSKTACTLRHGGVLRKEGVLESSIAYVTTADELARVTTARLSAYPSIVCIGEPPQSYMASKYRNVIWTEADVTIPELLEAISGRFLTYSDWELELERALARNEPLKSLAELSLPLLGKPVWMWDCHYQTLFNLVDESAYELPPTYAYHEDNAPWPVWEINAWRDGESVDVEASQALREPYILPATELFDYSALAYNLFIGDRYAATLTLEEVGSPITDRDFVLIEKLGDVLGQALRRTDLFNITATDDLVHELEGMLKGKQVSRVRMEAALASIGWSAAGPFCCAVAHATSPLYSRAVITATAEKICSALQGVVFVVDGADIVFVISSRAAQRNPLDAAREIFELFRQHKYQMTMGVSTPFGDLENLYHYRIQAECAIEIGSRVRKAEAHGHRDNESNCYYFEDYILDFIVHRCCTRMLPETLCPPELMALIDYDRRNYSEFCITLREFLRNNMQISETARQLFIHRNSLIMRIKKIKAIMQCDLDDPDTRLAIQLAFKILGDQLDVLHRDAPTHGAAGNEGR